MGNNNENTIKKFAERILKQWNPCDLETLCKEISEITGLNIKTVCQKVWKEALMVGANVVEDALKYDLNFHEYDEKMEKFYKDSYAFIFETLVESCRPLKQEVIRVIKERIEKYIKEKKKQQINILMFGDGVGSDTIYLYRFLKDKATFYYFDVPGSKTFNFALKRFARHNIQVKLLTEYHKIPQNFFDIVISLEVLEHLPNPIEGIKDINSFLKTGGKALITESFGAVVLNFPTHLKTNLKYSGKTPFLFLKHNMILTYYNTSPLLFLRPMEFEKKEKTSLSDWLKLISNKPIIKNYLRILLRKLI
jgi:SAM-dependent methyltransferase